MGSYSKLRQVSDAACARKGCCGGAVCARKRCHWRRCQRAELTSCDGKTARKGRRWRASPARNIHVVGAREFCARMTLLNFSDFGGPRCMTAPARRMGVAEAGRDVRDFCALALSHMAGMGHFYAFSCDWAILRQCERARLTYIVAGSGRQLRAAVDAGGRLWARAARAGKPWQGTNATRADPRERTGPLVHRQWPVGHQCPPCLWPLLVEHWCPPAEWLLRRL